MDPMQMALFVVVTVVLLFLALTFVGPKVTQLSRKQWALLLATLFVLWVPMGWYLMFVVSASKSIDPRHVARGGA